MFTIELYTIDTSDGSFSRTAEISTYTSLSWVNEHNRAGQAYFTVNVFDQSIATSPIIKYRTVVAIKNDNTIIWVGYVSHIATTSFQVSAEYTIECTGYMGHLYNRFTTKLVNFVQQDAGAIAWSLIDTAQSKTNGKIGIAQGNIETTQTRDRTYEYGNVYDAIVDLTEVINGFDFDLTYLQDTSNQLDGLEFNVYREIGVIKTNLPTLRTGENVDIFSVATTGEIINSVTAIGAGFGENILTKLEEDSDSQVSFTRREGILSLKDISVPSTLEQRAEEYLRFYQSELYNITIVLLPNRQPSYDSVIIGDYINIDLVQTNEQGSTAFEGFKGYAKIIGIENSVLSTGVLRTIFKLEFRK